MQRKSILKAFLVVACVFALAGCTTVKGWFGGKDDDKPTEPAKLVEFTPTATVNKLWSVGVGKGEGRIGIRQGPSIADGRVYAAAIGGGVRAFDLQTGAAQWHFDPKPEKDQPKLQLSGGPGAGEGLVVVGGLNGEVIALDASNGAEKWRAKVGNEVIASPVIGNGMVFVRSNDGRLTAFDAASGERRWFWVRELPSLSVRGNDAPVLGPGAVFVGNDDGTVAALSMQDGTLVWEQAVAQADGRTELDRMADIDGTPVFDGAILYATSFKRQTMAIDAPSGRPIWARDSGGAGRLGNASDRLVVVRPGRHGMGNQQVRRRRLVATARARASQPDRRGRARRLRRGRRFRWIPALAAARQRRVRRPRPGWRRCPAIGSRGGRRRAGGAERRWAVERVPPAVGGQRSVLFRGPG